MKKLIFSLLALAISLPSAIAFNCNSLSGGDLYVCNSIQNTNLTLYEKDLLIADIFNKNKTYPDFDFVYSWNANLEIKDSLDGKHYSSGTINNAWINIISLMPSVIENNTLYSSDNGKLLTAYNYGIILPSGTEYTDCSTEYSLSSQSEELNIILNEVVIGHDKLTSFSIKDKSYESLAFKAELNIQVTYRVIHYKWMWVKNYQKCKYYSTEYRTDNLKLTDILNSQLYRSQLNSSFRVVDEYYNTTKGTLKADNFTNLILSFNNSVYQDSKYIYSLNYTLPYYVLTLKAEKIENVKFNNINVDKNDSEFYFTVRDTSNCKIRLFDHFSSITKQCDLSFNEPNFYIKTDKTNYYENDTIRVQVFPPNITVSLSYANESREVQNYTEFKAVLYQNRIISKVNDKEVDWLININKKENTIILYNLGILYFLGYFFYRVAKAYYLGAI